MYVVTNQSTSFTMQNMSISIEQVKYVNSYTIYTSVCAWNGTWTIDFRPWRILLQNYSIMLLSISQQEALLSPMLMNMFIIHWCIHHLQDGLSGSGNQ